MEYISFKVDTEGAELESMMQWIERLAIFRGEKCVYIIYSTDPIKSDNL